MFIADLTDILIKSLKVALLLTFTISVVIVLCVGLAFLAFRDYWYE